MTDSDCLENDGAQKLEHGESFGEFAANSERFITWCHKVGSETQNPVYAWMALMARWWVYSRPDNPDRQSGDLAIPAWCADYFGSSAQTIEFLASSGIDFRLEPQTDDIADRLDSKMSVELVSEALGFSRQGFNAFKQRRADMEAAAAAARAKELKSGGAKYDSILNIIASELPAMEISGVRRRISRGRLFLPDPANDEKPSR